jgi:hypothetical protein
MAPFALDHWIVIALVFLLGLFIGGSMFASTKWKRRYKDEARRREELEADNKRLHREAGEMESLRHAAAKHPVDRDRRPL